MNAARRQALAAAARKAVPRAQRATTASWADLMPASADWGVASTRRARTASRVALEALAMVLEQGDLDDRTWERTRHTVHAEGRATTEQAAELLRTVRVVGVEVLADALEKEAGLTPSERWQLQQEASAFFDRLLDESPELDPESYSEMLTTLERSGPDLA